MGLTATGCQARRTTLIQQTNVDVIVITNPRHIFYFSNLRITPLNFGSWGLPFLIIETSSGKTTLVVDNFLGGDASAAFVDDQQIWTWYDAAQNAGVSNYPVGLEHLAQRLKGFAGKRVGIEGGWMPQTGIAAEYTDITPIIEAMRRRKDADEIALIREALRVTEAGHRAVREALQAGRTEIEMHSILYGAIANAAGYPILLMGDVISGERGALIAGAPTRRTLHNGDLIIFDVAPIVNGYRADFTATLCVGGKLTDQQQRVETALHNAIQAGVAALMPGAKCCAVYQTVLDSLRADGFGDAFPHHAGHGLGLGHPEAPYLVPNSDEEIAVGDIITLEPGIYGQDWGARIEHEYLITDDGIEQLTHHQTTFT